MCDDRVYIDRLLAALACAGRATVLRYREDSVSGEMLRNLIFRYAVSLRRLGIGRGDLLGLIAPNSPQAIAVRYAAHVLGAATVYLSIPSSAAARRALIDQIKPDLLVVFAETAGLFDCRSSLPFATIGLDESGSVGRLDKMAAVASSEPIEVAAMADDLAVIASSGGSTGIPKGSCRSFSSYSGLVSAPSSSDRIQLINGKLAYLSQVLVDITLLGGGRVVLQDGYEADATLAAIEAEGITDLFLVEPQLFDLIDRVDVQGRDLSSLRSLLHIGASAPPSLRLRARKRFGRIVEHAYGASEMGLVSVLAAAEYCEGEPGVLTSAGHVLKNVQLRFRRVDGSIAEAGEAGSIEVRSAAMASGYWNNPVLTERSFHDGWYKTGDLGYLDITGRLHVLGRAVDAQQVDGMLVMPADVEETLCCQASVRYAVVVRDAEAKQTIAAVVAWSGMSIDDRECRQAVSQKFGRGFAASLTMVEVDRVPLTEQGKPDRSAFPQLARKRMAA